MSVIRLPGVQSEMELAYGALHGLWSQLAEEDVERLPGPQRVALRVTFGLATGAALSPLLVGLAMLSGLADLAERQPLLVVVDDAQWLDQASARTLAFVARRLGAEAVGIVFAVRESIEPLMGLPELLIPNLDRDAARGGLASSLRAVLLQVPTRVALSCPPASTKSANGAMRAPPPARPHLSLLEESERSAGCLPR